MILDKKRRIFLIVFSLRVASQLNSQAKNIWGVQGKGTYINLILKADYSALM